MKEMKEDFNINDIISKLPDTLYTFLTLNPNHMAQFRFMVYYALYEHSGFQDITPDQIIRHFEIKDEYESLEAINHSILFNIPDWRETVEAYEKFLNDWYAL